MSTYVGQQMYQKQEILVLHCLLHDRNLYQFISINKEDINKLLCPECLIPIDKGATKKDLNDLIPLSIAMNSPEQFIKWMHKDADETLFRAFQFSERNLEQDFLTQIKNFDQLKNIIEKIQLLLKEQLKEYKSLQEKFKKLREQYLENIQYNSLRNVIFQLQKLDQKQESDEYIEVLKEVSNIITVMVQNKGALVCKEFQEIKKTYDQSQIGKQSNQNEKFKKEIEQLFNQNSKFTKAIHDEICFTPSLIFNNNNFEEMRKRIQDDSKKQIRFKNKIYEGTRDGLNVRQFWHRVDGKRNLLMIFKSKKNNIFGAYSPCQWQSIQKKYVHDDSLNSFLFSFHHHKFFNLKQECRYNAIHCDVKNGPCFGQTDFHVNSDFSIRSKLGDAYHITEDDKKISENITGEANPQIEECEIYEYFFA